MVNLRARVKRALERILENKDCKALNWAVNYAKHALSIIDTAPDSELKTQLLYTVGNITHWRGDTAKAVRGVLKEAVKALA